MWAEVGWVWSEVGSVVHEVGLREVGWVCDRWGDRALDRRAGSLRGVAGRIVGLMTSSSAIQTTRLDSGITVVSEHMPSALSICTAVWVGVGSRDETPDQAGCSHFLEHLAFKGTENRSALELAQSIDEVGGEMNAYTTKEHTTYYVRTVAEDAELAIEILGDILTRPALRDDDVASEKQVILEEIAMRADEPADLVHDSIHEVMFGDHPLGRDIAGSPETVRGLMSSDIRTFLDATYTPSEIVVAAAGLVDHDQLVKDVDLHLQRPSTSGPAARVAPPAATKRLEVISDDTEQVHLIVAVPGIARNDPDRFAVGLLDHVLGGGMSSRCFRKFVRSEALLIRSIRIVRRTPMGDTWRSTPDVHRRGWARWLTLLPPSLIVCALMELPPTNCVGPRAPSVVRWRSAWRTADLECPESVGRSCCTARSDRSKKFFA